MYFLVFSDTNSHLLVMKQYGNLEVYIAYSFLLHTLKHIITGQASLGSVNQSLKKAMCFKMSE